MGAPRLTRARWGAALAVAAGIQLLATASPASTTIDVRFSIKVIKRPVTGTRPPMTPGGFPVTDGRINFMVDRANDSLLTAYWRGYRFTVTEILDVGTCGASCDSSDPGFWYDVPFTGDWDMKRFEYWAKLYPAFLWSSNAVNIYINAGKGNGAVASFPPPDPRSNDVVFVGSLVFDAAYAASFPAAILHHELGHYFNLPHPNGSLEDCCDAATCITDGDGIEDTLPDGPCFTLDQISTHRYGQPFANVNAVKQDSLLDMFWNNMCYLHPDQKDDPGEGYGQTFLPRLTELQLDRWTDAANGVRANVRSAKTHFVKVSPCGICPPATGTSTDPYRNVPEALSAASPGDILMLRPGVYTGPFTINQPVTLRATRTGPAVITN